MGCGESQMCTFRETPTHPNKAREEKEMFFQRNQKCISFSIKELKIKKIHFSLNPLL